MDNEMGKLVQEKKVNMEAFTVTTIPTVIITVPSTSLAPLPTTLTTTTLATSSATDSRTTTAHPIDEEGKLIKSMQDMSIQTNEINRL